MGTRARGGRPSCDGGRGPNHFGGSHGEMGEDTVWSLTLKYRS